DPGERQDVLVDVLALAAEGADRGHAKQVGPQTAQRGLARSTDRDLLQAEHAERPRRGRRAARRAAGRFTHRAGSARTSSSVRSPGRGALTRIAMLPEGCRLSRMS